MLLFGVAKGTTKSGFLDCRLVHERSVAQERGKGMGEKLERLWSLEKKKRMKK